MRTAIKNSLMVFGIIAAASIGITESFATEDARVSGVDAIKTAIREGASRGGIEGVRNLGPWRLSYTGEIRTGKEVNLLMLPEDAFSVTRESDARTFTVSLTAPSRLFTSLGNLREMGVQVSIVDINAGRGQSSCAIFAEFNSTGTNQPLNLQNIRAANPNSIRMTVSPPNAAQLTGFTGTHANFTRRSGDTSAVTVTLEILDSGNWYTFNAQLASCGAAAPTPARQPQMRWTTVRNTLQFSLSGSEPSSGSFDTRTYACNNAKRSLEDTLNENHCYAEALTRYRQLTIIDARVSGFFATCECERDSFSCYSCEARGNAQCIVTYEERVQVPVN